MSQETPDFSVCGGGISTASSLWQHNCPMKRSWKFTSPIHGSCTSMEQPDKVDMVMESCSVPPTNKGLSHTHSLSLRLHPITKPSMRHSSSALSLPCWIDPIRVFGDSQLVVNQLFETYAVRKPELVPYINRVHQLLRRFNDIQIAYLPRKQNAHADALASLAASFAEFPGSTVEVVVSERRILPSLHEREESSLFEIDAISVMEVHVIDWRQPFIDYLQYGRLPDDPQQRSMIRRRVRGDGRARSLFPNRRP